MLEVSRSGYYQSLKAAPSTQATRRESIKQEVIRFHDRSMGIYGYRKVAEDIRKEGQNDCCDETVRRIMRENKLCAKVKHKFVVTTQSKHSLPVAENILERDFHSDAPTAVPTFHFLDSVIDLLHWCYRGKGYPHYLNCLCILVGLIQETCHAQGAHPFHADHELLVL